MRATLPVATSLSGLDGTNWATSADGTHRISASAGRGHRGVALLVRDRIARAFSSD